MPTSSNFGLVYYNVLEEARYGTDAWECIDPGPPPAIFTPAFTTGGLTQGILGITISLTKSPTTLGLDTYTDRYTILHRATPTDTWQIATADASSPTNPGTGVGNYNELTVNVSGASTASQTYYFSATGEYVVRTTGVHNGNGCQSSGCYTCAETKVAFFDAVYGPTATPCPDCDGPL